MAVNDTDVSIASTALVSIGEESIGSFSGQVGEAAGSIYVSVRKELLYKRPWFFNMETFTLSQLSDAPLGDFLYAYQLPDDFGLLRQVQREVLDYELNGSELWTDYNGEFWIRYQKMVAEALMPDWFVTLMEKRLMHRFAVSIKEDMSMARELREDYLDELRTMALVHAQQKKSRVMGGRRGRRGSLASVRY